MKRIAVLMTVFNRKKITLRCLQELYKQNYDRSKYTLDIYLTNDGCTDGTPEAVKEYFPEVNIIDGDGTLYWNRGMWMAWDKASRTDTETLKLTETPKFDWYLWLNDDTELLPGAIDSLVTESECHEGANIIVGATKASDSDILTYGGRVKKSIPPCDGFACEIEYFNGNIVLVNASAFEKLGNLDYYYTHSKGDYDYGVRAKQAGVKMYQCGHVVGICDLHKKLDRWCDPDIPLAERIRLLYKPIGMPPHETFHLEKRQFGIVTAFYHWFTVHFRCLFPKLWMNVHNSKE